MMPRLRGFLVTGGVVVVTIAGAAGIAADAAGASATRAVSIGYTCAFPAGTYRVSVEIAATVASGPVRAKEKEEQLQGVK